MDLVPQVADTRAMLTSCVSQRGNSLSKDLISRRQEQNRCVRLGTPGRKST